MSKEDWPGASRAEGFPTPPPQGELRKTEQWQTYAPNGNLSASVADALYRKVLSDRLGRYLSELDDTCGPLTEEEIEAAEREWRNAP